MYLLICLFTRAWIKTGRCSLSPVGAKSTSIFTKQPQCFLHLKNELTVMLIQNLEPYYPFWQCYFSLIDTYYKGTHVIWYMDL